MLRRDLLISSALGTILKDDPIPFPKAMPPRLPKNEGYIRVIDIDVECLYGDTLHKTTESILHPSKFVTKFQSPGLREVALWDIIIDNVKDSRYVSHVIVTIDGKKILKIYVQ